MSILWNRALKTSEQTLVSLTANILLRTHQHFAHHSETVTWTYLASQFHMTVIIRIASFCNTKMSSTVWEYTRILLLSTSSSLSPSSLTSTPIHDVTSQQITSWVLTYLFTWWQIEPSFNTPTYPFNTHLHGSENSALPVSQSVLHGGRQSSVCRSSNLPWDHLEETDVTEEKWF